MKAYFFFLAAAMALLSAGCGSIADQSTNATSAANARNATAGTAQQAPTGTPTPEKKTDAVEGKTVTVRFPTGATEASYTDSFSGYGTIDYKFDAKADQELTVEITSSDKNKAILTVMRYGEAVESDASMVQGWTGVLPANGGYTIRVGQMRSDARGGNTPVKFGLRIQIVD
jgi:hypothetical protein